MWFEVLPHRTRKNEAKSRISSDDQGDDGVGVGYDLRFATSYLRKVVEFR
jgi:hypothetical protein